MNCEFWSSSYCDIRNILDTRYLMFCKYSTRFIIPQTHAMFANISDTLFVRNLLDLKSDWKLANRIRWSLLRPSTHAYLYPMRICGIIYGSRVEYRSLRVRDFDVFDRLQHSRSNISMVILENFTQGCVVVARSNPRLIDEYFCTTVKAIVLYL